MGKEKKMYLEENKKQLTFYYELIGVGTILISLIALARLGVVGYYVMMTFRIVFGDWYFAFLLALLLFGIYCLFKHQPLNVLNMRFIGIILLMISLLTLAHFPMHNYVNKFGTSYLKMTFNLYLDYFKNYEEGMVVGGGIIGMLFFYLFYTLFSSIGTIVIVIFLTVVGLSFSFNKTIGETLGFIKKIMIKIWNFLKKIKKTIKYDIKVDEKEKKEEKKNNKTKKITIDDLLEPVRQNYIITEEKHAISLKKTLSNVLNSMNIFYEEISYVVSEHVTTLKVDTIANINLDKLYMRLKAILTEKFLITKDLDSPKIKVEIENIDPNPPFLKTMFILQKNYLNNLKLGIGIDTDNIIVELDLNNMYNTLLIDNNTEQTAKIFLGYLMMLKIKLTKINYDFIFLDPGKMYKKAEKMSYYCKEVKECLSILKNDIEKRLDLLNQNNCQDIFEYNKRYFKNIDVKFIFILNLENILKDNESLNLLLYLIGVSSSCGYRFIIHYNDQEVLSTTIDSLFSVKLLGKNSKESSNHYIGINPINYLADDESFYMHKDELFRVSLVVPKEEEIEKIINC